MAGSVQQWWSSEQVFYGADGVDALRAGIGGTVVALEQERFVVRDGVKAQGPLHISLEGIGSAMLRGAGGGDVIAVHVAPTAIPPRTVDPTVPAGELRWEVVDLLADGLPWLRGERIKEVRGLVNQFGRVAGIVMEFSKDMAAFVAYSDLDELITRDVAFRYGQLGFKLL